MQCPNAAPHPAHKWPVPTPPFAATCGGVADVLTEDAPVLSEAALDAFADVLSDAKAEANIDGHGDEGAGYDYRVMARYLLAKGYGPLKAHQRVGIDWLYQKKEN